ncbi:UTP--glucose-1-phosphate uridylyltransferase GalU [Sneathiella chungangensis]|uniref:UTP--glucose-1-phosphate uridylyltransferase n=1 Tax=Sneathiella chungangensis TaxID=1418234 RepID=A0A845MEY0_9PROT|nr:UTP--glucose-1-phosphate uridylyltransferase GalU [Sneathiella chungangensis]MZR21604.1 UTP--glucose-1-phosphate uridylyltransferase GalU [Sneathiella chungangensis]
MPKKVRKAVFPVGGLGTRFLPATKAMPKEMLPVVDKPLIQYAVEEARDAGIEEFFFVTGRGKTIIEDHFDKSYELESVLIEREKRDLLEELQASVPKAGTIAYIRQQEPLGLGHAVWCAKRLVGDEPFAVILADDLILADTPCLAQMTAAREKIGGGNMLAVMEVPKAHTSRYGILSPGEEQGKLIEIKGLVEKPAPADAPSNLAVIGRYILEPNIFPLLEKQARGAGNEIQLTDALSSLLGGDSFYGMKFDGTRYDCGDKIGFLEANIAFALNRGDMRSDMRDIVKKIASEL